MKKTYRTAMEWLYVLCIGLSGIVMLVMTMSAVPDSTMHAT